jgi:gliding motility-associated lipoprotein GldH
MKNFFYILTLIVATALLFSCKSKSLYEHYVSPAASGWDKDSTTVFSFNSDKTYLSYDVLINIRNRSDYTFSNLWLFVDVIAPDSTSIRDTVEYQLALPNGKWTGKGTSGMYHNQFIFRQNVFFPKEGTYTIKINHAMRPNPLSGISDVGILVRRNQQK